MTDRQRFELAAVALYLGTQGLQDTIDYAVNEFVRHCYEQVPGFAATVQSAEANRRKLAGVRSIEGRERSGDSVQESNRPRAEN